MTEGQGLELVPFAEFGNAGVLAEDDVLVTHAVHAFAVQGQARWMSPFPEGAAEGCTDSGCSEGPREHRDSSRFRDRFHVRNYVSLSTAAYGQEHRGDGRWYP